MLPIDSPHARAVRRRLFGFVLALVLTLAAFGMVRAPLEREWILGSLAVLAAVQMGVHLGFFLDLGRHGTRPEIRLAVGFALLLIAIMVGGTAWIMSDLHLRMMAGG